MSSTTSSHTWDFTPVFDLLSSLKQQDVATSADHGEFYSKSGTDTRAFNGSIPHESITGKEESQALGDFARLWNFLGVQPQPPTVTIPPFEASTAAKKLDLDVYASDGAIYYPPSSRSVQWRDEVGYGVDVADTQPESPPTPNLTKTQRKKKNRKARKELERMTFVDSISKKEACTHAASDADEDDTEVPTEPPAIQAALHGVTGKSESNKERKRKLNEMRKEASLSSNIPEAATDTEYHAVASFSDSGAGVGSSDPTREHLSGLRPAQVTPSKTKRTTAASQGSAATPAEPEYFRAPIEPPKTPARTIINNTVHDSLRKEWPTAKPYAELLKTSTIPKTQTVPSQNTAAHPPASQKTSQISYTNQTLAIPTTTTTKSRHEIRPLTLHTSLDRNWSLLLKLMISFPADRPSLLSPLQLSSNRPHPNGIHVFVDASNILIGYHDHLKRVRGISRSARNIPRVYPSFHALALLLERRRPVAKRVLVGSSPEVAAFEEARQVGYETCVLDKVWKARELTERQKYFALRDSGGLPGGGGGSGGGSGSNGANGAVAAGYPSGSESASDTKQQQQQQQQQPKWVEQAVDEVIHLKMLESLVDTPVPPMSTFMSITTSTSTSKSSSSTQLSNNNTTTTTTNNERPTMVLATGDAAEAEYSSGFMRMVQRALERGWNVEVAAWGANISAAYRVLERREREKAEAVEGGGGGEARFKVVELDAFSEELFPEGA